MGARASAGKVLRNSCTLGQVHLHGNLVKGFGISFADGDGTCRAFRQAGAQTVAIGIRDESCLAVDHLQGSFMTGRYTEGTPVAFVFIDGDDISFHETSRAQSPGKMDALAFDVPIIYN